MAHNLKITLYLRHCEFNLKCLPVYNHELLWELTSMGLTHLCVWTVSAIAVHVDS